MTERLRVAVLGYVVRGPLGGMAWHHLQYVLGLARMGHDVWFVEDSDDYASCYDPSRHVVSTNPSYGMRFAADAFERLGIADRWAYRDRHGDGWIGPAAGAMADLAATADVLIDISGVNPVESFDAVPVRVLVDTDPVFTQIRHLEKPAERDRAGAHTAFFSYGELVESLPDDGCAWQPTRQPVVLDAWPTSPGRPNGAFTTLMQWDSYPPQTHDGREYGMKSKSFDLVADVPRRTTERFEIALGSENAPRAELADRGWGIRDPLSVSRDPWTYQDFITESKAEFSVAKHGYVAATTGWFSERTAGYLASGRPAVVQDTGFSQLLPTGEGLLAFSDADGAVAGVESVAGDYDRHCTAARELVREHFDARVVLGDLLERAA